MATDHGTLVAALERAFLGEGIAGQGCALGSFDDLDADRGRLGSGDARGTQHGVLREHFVVNLGHEIILTVGVAAPDLPELDRVHGHNRFPGCRSSSRVPGLTEVVNSLRGYGRTGIGSDIDGPVAVYAYACGLSGNGPLKIGIGDIQAMDAGRKANHELLVFGGLRGGLEDVLFSAGRPLVQVVDGAHLRLQHLFGTSEAGTHGGVHSAARGGDAKARGSEDCVLFGVNADTEIVGFSGFVSLVAVGRAITSAIEAVGHVLGSTVVSGRDNAFVEYDDGADAIAFAVGAQPNCHGDIHKIFVTVLAGIAQRPAARAALER